MQNYSAIINISRRNVCWSLGAVVINDVLAKLPFWIEQRSKMTAADPAFLIVNGWVLTSEDLAASDMTSDVV